MFVCLSVWLSVGMSVGMSVTAYFLRGLGFLETSKDESKTKQILTKFSVN